MKALGRILAVSRGKAGWLAAGILVSLCAVAAGVGLVVASGSLVAGAGAGQVVVAAGLFAALPVLVRALGVARVVLRYLERLVTHQAMFHALADLRVWLFRGMAASAAGGIGFRRSGDLASRLVSDVGALDGVYLRVLVPLAGAVLLLPALAAMLALQGAGPALAICGLFALAAFAIPALGMRASLQAGAGLAQAESGLRVAVLDAVSGLREVRAFGAEGRMLAAVQSREATLLRAQRQVAGAGALADMAAVLCGQGAVLLALASLHGPVLLAAPALFLTAAAFDAVGGLPRAGVLAGHAAAAACRVIEAAELPSPVPDPAHPAVPGTGASLRFAGVSARWQADRPPVLDGLTLDIAAGSRVAILGPSGSGKSTLAALALKVLAPEAGSVSLGGQDLATLAAADLRARIAWLGQATHLFDDSVRGNLLLGRPDATEAELWAALDQAALGDTVRAMPDGLETWVGEGGVRLSGGQGRRLALARALLSRAPVLILDEPAAGLDAETERTFLATLNGVAEGRTVVLIVHRLTGVERLDRIWRLSAGRAIAAMA